MPQQTRMMRDATAMGYLADDGELEARPLSHLAGKSDPFHTLITNGSLTTCELCETAEPDAQFFYTAAQFQIDESQFHNKKLAVESGIGYLHPSGSRLLFKRTAIHSRHEADETGQMKQTSGPFGTPYPFNNEDYFTIFAHTPDNYVQCLLSPYSVLCTVGPYEPSPVELPPSSVLGRLDGRIQAISFDQLRSFVGGTP